MNSYRLYSAVTDNTVTLSRDDLKLYLINRHGLHLDEALDVLSSATPDGQSTKEGMIYLIKPEELPTEEVFREACRKVSEDYTEDVNAANLSYIDAKAAAYDKYLTATNAAYDKMMAARKKINADHDLAIKLALALATTVPPIVWLECTCCGQHCSGRQWHGCDIGYGLCRSCHEKYPNNDWATECGVFGYNYCIPGADDNSIDPLSVILLGI